MFPIFFVPSSILNLQHLMLLIGTLGLFFILFISFYKERKEKQLAKETGQRRVFIGRSAIAASKVEPSQDVMRVAIAAASLPLTTVILLPNPLVAFIPLLLVIIFFKATNYFSETRNKKPNTTFLFIASLILTLAPLGYSAYLVNTGEHSKTYYLDSARNPSPDEQRNKLVTKISERDNGDHKEYKWVESSPQGVVETWGEAGTFKSTIVIVEDLQAGEEPYTTHTITLAAYGDVDSKQLCPLDKSLVKGCEALNAQYESSSTTIHLPKGEREKYVVPNRLL